MPAPGVRSPERHSKQEMRGWLILPAVLLCPGGQDQDRDSFWIAAHGADGKVTVTWPRVENAVRFDLYVALEPGVGPRTYRRLKGGRRIRDVEPPYPIRGLENGRPVYVVVAALRGRQRPLVSGEVAAVPHRIDPGAWFPFLPPFGDGTATFVDISGLVLDPPAGKHGFLIAGGETPRFEDGTPARFWGAALAGEALFPSRPEADRIAAELGKLGFNMVRLHLSTNWRWGRRNLIDTSKDHTQDLDPDRLDRLCGLIAALKERGIYVLIDLNLWRTVKAGDGLPHADWQWARLRPVTYVSDRFQELQRITAKKLLTHRNPYTRRRLIDEPAILMFQLINEGSIFTAWAANELHRWPPEFRNELESKWAAWRKQERLPPAQAEWNWEKRGDIEASLYREQCRFLIDLEIRFFESMRKFIASLGRRRLTLAVGQYYGLPTLYSQRVNDVMEAHGYWDHPVNIQWGKGLWDIKNHSMLRAGRVGHDPRFGGRRWNNVVPVMRWPLSHLEGKPLFVTEWAWGQGNAFAFEGPLAVAAYGRFQGIDALCLHAWEANRPFDREFWGRSPWSFRTTLPIRVQMQAASLLFLRGDVTEDPDPVILTFSEAEACSNYRQAVASYGFQKPGVPFSLPLVRGVRLRLTKTESREPGRFEVRPPYRSSTKELEWDPEAGLLRIDTARSQAVIGALKDAGKVGTRHLRIEADADAAASLVSLDRKPLSESGRMLFTLVGRSRTTGEERLPIKGWDAAVRVRVGKGPVLLEPVHARVELHGLRAGQVKVFALGPTGARKWPVPVERDGNAIRFRTGADETCWYGVLIGR